MKIASTLLLLLGMAVSAPALSAQEATTPRLDRRLSLNLFRAPSTGVDYRLSRRTSVHAGFYPTVLMIQGEREQVNLVRLGATFWLRPTGSTFYFSTGVALSLERAVWSDSFANEVGYSQRLGDRWSARLGANLLTTMNLERSRLNPTIGLSFRPGRTRAQ
jgi:hypothetical protein